MMLQFRNEEREEEMLAISERYSSVIFESIDRTANIVNCR